jgi:Protein of unknown function (DUF4230)
MARLDQERIDQGRIDQERIDQDRTAAGRTVRLRRGPSVLGWLAGLAAVIVAVAVLVAVLAAVHLLPRLRNPFGESTSVSSQPALLKSITSLSRYEAASGSYQVIVDLTRKANYLPSFLEGSQTLFVGQGSDIAYVDFSQLKGPAIQVSANRTAVRVTLPPPRLEPATLNVRQSYVFAQQRGLLDRVGSFFSSNPNNQQQLYVAAQQKIQAAARQSSLLVTAQRNTTGMLTSMLHSLGYHQVTVTFAAAPAHRAG